MTYPHEHLGLTDPIPLQDALLLGLQLADCPKAELWVDGRHLPTAPLGCGDMTFYDLRLDTQAYLESPVDHLQLYLPLKALNGVAEESNLARVDTLDLPLGVGRADPIVAHLGACLLPALHEADQIDPLFADSVAVALCTHLLTRYHGARFTAPVRGRLAAWQLRRAMELLASDLAGAVSIPELARECNLSAAYFTRAFRASVGAPPHRWLQMRRIERVKALLLRSSEPLAQIAIQCGFGDQSHMTKVFTRYVGIGPGAWRRRRRD
jgi:AraC-like DNA-binding protein